MLVIPLQVDLAEMSPQPCLKTSVGSNLLVTSLAETVFNKVLNQKLLNFFSI